MPIYEYYCEMCENKFELLKPMSKAHEEASCPEGHVGAKRAISLFAAFTTGDNGEVSSVGGGACACAQGGACACSGGF